MRATLQQLDGDQVIKKPQMPVIVHLGDANQTGIARLGFLGWRGLFL